MSFELGGKDDLAAVAALCHPVADDLFGLAALTDPSHVRVSRIEEVAIGRHELVEDREAHGFVGGPSERVGAKVQRKDIEFSTRDAYHVI